MSTFSFIIALGAIASATAGISPLSIPLVNVYNAVAPQPLGTPLATSVIVPEGHSLEGQYIPDNLEKLYDDGSYKAEITTLPLTTSPDGTTVPTGSGLEGEYVPDNLEKLYDDGSYKPEIIPLPLSPSPYGLVPSGSGLDGQYVPDVSEKLFNDGSYGPETVVKVVQ